MKSQVWTWLFIFAVYFDVASQLQAQNIFQQMVTPGDLAEAHAKYEKSCASCHAPMSRQSQSGLCLTCHKDIATDLRDNRGYHGKLPEIHQAECKVCHTDHKGRAADITSFDRDLFSHADTDYPLSGRHVGLECARCHAKGKYSKAPSDCFSCHQNADRHSGTLGKDCKSCHSEKSWVDTAPFDHTKTSYPLEDRHKNVPCAQCHYDEHYNGTAKTCYGCHEIQDVHAGRYETKCESCHVLKSWTEIRFDHTRDTKWPLREAHATLRCTACHKGDVYKDQVRTTCMGCHKSDDVHRGSLGPSCGSCHNETSWKKRVFFDHNKTVFPLQGLHARVKCEACHKTQSYKDVPLTCVGCHEDKTHRGALGAKCEQCHDATSWKTWSFDHDKQTRYPLTGAHVAAKCNACHSETNVVPPGQLPSDCYSCHASRDIHFGVLGKACGGCHTTKKWGVL